MDEFAMQWYSMDAFSSHSAPRTYSTGANPNPLKDLSLARRGVINLKFGAGPLWLWGRNYHLFGFRMRTSSVIHYVAPEEEIRSLANIKNSHSAKVRIAKKHGNAHVFYAAESSHDTLEPALRDKGLDLIQCSGCELCTQSEARRDALKYILYPPLILLPTGTSIPDTETRQAALDLLRRHKHCTHVAINRPIARDDRIRSPQIVAIVGDFGEFDPSPSPGPISFERAFWATSVQNGIFQTWAPMYTMFSRGNITEKKRVLSSFRHQAKIQGSTVLDLYCGIGYFTLPYAKQGPHRVYCWELNHWSVQGLLRAAKVNKVKARAVQLDEPYTAKQSDEIVVFVEDNQNAVKRIPELDLTNVSHINMGLLPHARDAIPIARALANCSVDSGPTVIHLHENVPEHNIDRWSLEMAEKLGTCLHVEKIKEYSPGVVHVCGDFSYKRHLET